MLGPKYKVKTLFSGKKGGTGLQEQTVSQYVMVYTGKISAKQRARVWFLKENKGLSLRKIAWKCEISKSSVAQICDRTSNQRSQVDKVYCKSGRPRKISERDVHALIRSLQ